MSSTSNKNANEGTLTQSENPYLNPDGSTNEDKLIEDLLAYQGTSPALVRASLAAISMWATEQDWENLRLWVEKQDQPGKPHRVDPTLRALLEGKAAL
ncbi:hypothetical protein [Armatimonas sp.]|uniref:hypothetical protein n=1 Tax=Armatimonas sp. TaxID=1872638 RepID=UPI00374D1D75